MSQPPATTLNWRRVFGRDDAGDSSLRLLFWGDVAFGREVATRVGQGAELIDLPDELVAADVVVLNLECCLSERATPWEPKQVYMSAPPDVLEQLRRLRGRRVANVANNHFLDYGEAGAADTVAALDAAGFDLIGLRGDDGSELQPIATPHGRVALLAFAPTAHPLPGEPGLNVEWYDPSRVRERIRQAKAHADVVIVSLHQGEEYSEHIDRGSRLKARQMVDWGADCVINHHAHVIQPMELYRDRPILHGIGNLLIDLEHKQDWQSWYSYVVRVSVSAGAIVAVDVVPTRINPDLSVTLADAAEAERIHQRFLRLSRLLSHRPGILYNDLRAGGVTAVRIARSIVTMIRRYGLGAALRYYSGRLSSRMR